MTCWRSQYLFAELFMLAEFLIKAKEKKYNKIRKKYYEKNPYNFNLIVVTVFFYLLIK